jgi:hypothetical protein
MRFRAPLFSLAMILSLAAYANISLADVYCSETVTGVVMHSNGNVYFTTSGTCALSWCEIAFVSADANNKAYALLLIALTTGKPVAIDWPNITGCTQQNVVYAVPGFITLPQ